MAWLDDAVVRDKSRHELRQVLAQRAEMRRSCSLDVTRLSRLIETKTQVFVAVLFLMLLSGCVNESTHDITGVFISGQTCPECSESVRIDRLATVSRLDQIVRDAHWTPAIDVDRCAGRKAASQTS